jgi:hypothetical protein
VNNPQAVDWSGLKAAAIALQSVQDAARRAASTLPVSEQQRFIERVNKRAYRERWLDHAKALSLSAPTNAKPLSNSVQSGSELLLTRLKSHGDNTKQNLAEVAENASKVLLKKKGNALLKQHQAFKNFVSGSGQLHGWDEGKGSAGPTLNVLSIGGEMHISS